MKPDSLIYRLAMKVIKLLAGIAAIMILAPQAIFADGQIFLGPIVEGTPDGGSNWLTGAHGAGVTFIDHADAGRGGFDFTISNTVAGEGNNADWRSLPFSLGSAAGGARPITFSFAYKFVGDVLSGNNMHIQLRFFDSTGTNFVLEHVLRVGANTGDSSMGDYKTMTIKDIPVPRKARTADVWINANIYEPWVSGIGRFKNISVTTAPRSLLFKTGVAAVVLLGTVSIVFFWRRHALANQ
jgi:hypothetical protein